MRVLRRGDVGPDVAEIRSMLTALGLSSTEAQTQRLRPGRRARGPHVPAAPRPDHRRRGRPRTYQALRGASCHLGSRPLAYRFPPRSTATTSSPCRTDSPNSATTRAVPTASSARTPRARCALSSATTAWPTASAVRPPCGRSPAVPAGPRWTPVLLREQERVRQAGPRLRGKRIVIDPGHGGDAPASGSATPRGRHAWDLARRLEGRMKATGMEALISRGRDHGPTEADRAKFANDAGADLFLSLHSDRNSSPRPKASPASTSAPATAPRRRSARRWPGSSSASWSRAPACATAAPTARPGTPCA